MHEVVKNVFEGIEVGPPAVFEQMTVFPLALPGEIGPEYVLSAQALGSGELVISEIDEGGQVESIAVDYSGATPVLIIAGEELIGAKQNRIVNSSIVIAAKGRTMLPVSCVEQGRWAWRSRRFQGSKQLAAARVRRHKMRSVSKSLERTGSRRSDQSGVWREVRSVLADAEVESHTGAMADGFERRRHSIEAYSRAFERRPGQQGMVVALGGEVVGLELLSCPRAYAMVHDKVISSYAMEALAPRPGRGGSPSRATAARFLERCRHSRMKRYSSPGKGWEYRLEDEDLAGAALVWRKTVCHMTVLAEPVQ